MSLAASVIKYRNERRRRGAMPADADLLAGLWGGFAFQRDLESSLAQRSAA